MERVWSTSRRGFSARSVFMFVLTVLITALLLVTLGSHSITHAADAPPATWNGESILYNGHQYFSQGVVKSGDSIGLPQGTHYYLYTPDTTNAANSTGAQTSQKAFIIYFASGTDPPKATTATLATYDYSSSKVFSNQTDKQSIAITIQGNQTSTNSCTIQGIGWIICPITTFLADGMDNIFNLVKGFLFVQPPTTTNTHNDLYIAWNVMRSIANVAFIIVFIIIIYSQLVNAGVSNYGLKKLLPRLIVAAILVNLSYFICAIAVDISNILGYSLQDIFVNIRKSTFNINNDTWANSDSMGWSAVTAFVLSGGVASVGVLIATGGTIGAAIYLLVPLIIGLLLTILLVLVILAARQAIIIILIVIAPLAFVAFLLPNTEQLFKKWRELFLSMLVFFPAFSLVFGGSQLAGGIIIQNATSIVGVIFGMAVQVAPLAITPLILRLSGGILGKIAGLVNNPKKGMLDRTKAWTGNRAAMHRQRGIGGPLKKNQVFRRAARGLAYNNRRVEKRTEQYKAGFEEYGTRRDISSRSGQKTEVETAMSKLATEEMRNNLGQAMEELRAGNTSGLRRLRTQGDYSTIESIRTSRVGKVLPGGQLTEEEVTERREARIDKNKTFAKYGRKVVERAVELDQSSRIIARATASAQTIQQERFSQAMIASETMQRQAGGIDPNGADSALAAAINTVRESYGKSIAEARAINKHFNLSADQRQAHAIGQVVRDVRDSLGNVRTFTAESIFTREAAIEDQMATGTVAQINQLVVASGSTMTSFKTSIAEGVAKNNLGAKTLYLGGKTIDDIAQGKIGSQEDLTRVVLETVAKGKISEKDLASLDKDAVQILADAVIDARQGRGPQITDRDLAPVLQERIMQFSAVALDTLSGDERVNVKPNAKEHILRIARLTDPTYQEAPPPEPTENGPQG